jgi:hypothetical protein
MSARTSEDSVRLRAAKLKVVVAVTPTRKGARWVAVSQNACEAMAALRPTINRFGDSQTLQGGWEAVARALDSVFVPCGTF